MTKSKKQNPPLSKAEKTAVVFSAFLSVMLLKFPSIVGNAVTEALRSCATLLIPSLFPIMVASEVAIGCGAIDILILPVQNILSKTLGIKKDALSPYFLGLFGGYIASARGAVMLYNDGIIDKSECERLISISNMPSCAYLTGFVGIYVLKNKMLGWMLWMICIASTLILSALTKKKAHKTDTVLSSIPYSKKENKSSFSKIFVDAISHSASSMLTVCACVVFFSALIATLKLPLGYLAINPTLKEAPLGSLEVTYGVLSCIDIENTAIKMALIGFFIGWSGMCVHFQVMALCEGLDISFKSFFPLKLIQGLVCSILTVIICIFVLKT